jgi:hypothetical protein
MSYKVTLTHEQWTAIDAVAEENVNRFAGWIADNCDNPEKANWVASVKPRYEVWKDIRQSLIDSEYL